MIQLATCGRCDGFLALSLRSCPHCGAPIGGGRRILFAMAALAGGGAVSMTLMACYGAACVDGADCIPDPGAGAGDAQADVPPAADAGNDVQGE